ncbi:unnamed protein product [Kuraishia capsulata CBS 1993]|uniref:Phytase-like domain-containing protein n=1 Tax=Kuraishia capsulata CBS 1993 TaxID=1382522 RepID=W6MTK1_9ASCO|nr:uncharacterized protein KUCA_T00004495001 [Kuraishia capsulata CBS 1993]CDK28512.1 unnamed protein product [Kuraishia capsulata CBS 1993]
MVSYRSLLAAAIAVTTSSASFVPDNLSADDPVSSISIDGIDFVYEGLVGYGALSGSTVDKFGDTISIGSSLKIQKNTITTSKDSDGNLVYSFTVYGLPDRGWNTNGTLNFANRLYKLGVTFTPASSSSDQNIVWNYEDSILLRDPSGTVMSGLDCNSTIDFDGFPDLPAVRYSGDGFGGAGGGGYTVCLDSEAVELIGGDIENGFWISDEYGPYSYRFGGDGILQAAFQPPSAFLPRRKSAISFSADSAPIYDPSLDSGDTDSGRVDNQGFEGMTISPDAKYGYLLIQSALTQDGGDSKTSNNNARMIKYDLSTLEAVAEYVLELPTFTDPTKKASANPRTAAQSEILYLADDKFLVLARDSGHGRAQDDTTSIYRKICVYGLSNASDILGLYDGATDSIAPSGNLIDSITPAVCHPLVDINDANELTKFGLHNGGDDNEFLLNEKWESMDVFPVEGTTDEFYLLIASDDDFITQNGFMNFGRFPYADSTGANLDSQSLIFKVKLPTLEHNITNTTSTTSASTSIYPMSTFSSIYSAGYGNHTLTTLSSDSQSESTSLLVTTVTTVVPCSTNPAGAVSYTESTEVLTITCTTNKCVLPESSSSSSSISGSSYTSPATVSEIQTNGGAIEKTSLFAVLSFVLFLFI